MGILLLCILISYTWNLKRLKPVENGIYEDTFEVLDVLNQGIVLKGKNKILVYDDGVLKPGDVIEAKIKVLSLEKASYSGDFDAKEYYAAKGITNRGRLIQYSIVNKRWNISRLKMIVLDFFQNRLGSKSFSYVQTLFFGQNELNTEVKNAYSLLYLSHILTISGLHIQFLYKGLLWIFQKIFRIRGEHLATLLLGIYVVFIGCPISCLRAFLFLFLGLLNKKSALPYTKLDIFSMSFIGIVFFSPFQAFQLGFIYSFMVSFILLFMDDYNISKNKITKSFLQTVLCVCSIIPFLINQTYEISVIGILLSCLLGILLGKILLPISFIILILPYKEFDFIYDLLDQGIISLVQFTFPIKVPTLSFFEILLYYVIFFYILFCLAKKKKIVCFIYLFFYFFILFSIEALNPFYTVTFIDVGQGDSILIEFPYNKGKVLIDSYGSNVEYLKSRGIDKIEYVILTHFDKDHMGSIQEVVKNFNVECILYSAYEDESKIKDLNVEKRGVSSGDYFLLNEIKFEILGPIVSYEDSNSNSVVLRFTLDGYTFLMTGDMTEEEEKDLIKKYGKKLDSDVLKVGHHGSNSSSSQEFIDIVSPLYSIISVGENNSYHLPSPVVYERLNAISSVYMTKDVGNINIYIKNGMYLCPYREDFFKEFF